MKNFRTNLFGRVRRWWQRGSAPEDQRAATLADDQALEVRQFPDPLESFVLSRRERRALHPSNLGRPVLQFSNNPFAR